MDTGEDGRARWVEIAQYRELAFIFQVRMAELSPSASQSQEESKEESKEDSKEVSKVQQPVEEEKKAPLVQVDFKLPEKDTWDCATHHMPVIFYCKNHRVFFCPICLMAGHSTCFQQQNVFDVNGVKGLINECKDNMAAQAQAKVAELAKCKEDCVAVYKTGELAASQHTKLYTLISSTVEELKTKRAQDVAQGDSEIASKGKEYSASIDKVLQEYTNAIATYTNIAQKEQTLMKELITDYRKMWELHGKVNLTACDKLKETIKEYKEEQQKGQVSYEADIVRAQLEQTFLRIHNENIEDRDEQASSSFLYSLSPLATTLSVFDVMTRITRTHELVLADESFTIPYGAATVQVTGLIFITGGSRNLIEPINECREYSLLKERLAKRPDLKRARSEHCMAFMRDMMYCVGGHSESAPLKSCERCAVGIRHWKQIDVAKMVHKDEINIAMYQWKEIKELETARSAASLCAFKKHLYVFGGVSEDKMLSSIERLDVTDDNASWDRVGETAGFKVSYIGCIQAGFHGQDGFLLLGGNREENKPSKEVFFLPAKEGIWKPSATHVLEPLAGCELPECEDFCNREPIRGKVPGQFYMAGKYNYYKLDLTLASPKIEILSEASCDYF